MVALAGQYLNLALQDLKLHRNLKVNRVTQVLTVSAGTYGPFALESDYLRTYDLFYQIQGPNGETQFLTPISMEQFDAKFKGTATADYPTEFATDLSTQVATFANPVGGSVTSIVPATPGIGYLSLPGIAFGGPGAGAAATATLTCVGFFANWANGSGYLPNDIVTLVGGTFTRPATLRVIEPGFGMQVVDGGAYTVLPGNPAVVAGNLNITGDAGTLAVSGGSGLGMQVRVTWGVGTCTVTAGGAGYVTAPVANSFGGTPNSSATFTTAVAPIGGGSAGNLYIYPQANGSIALTHRYMRDQPDIVSPETSSVIPWFNYQDYLVKQTAARLMGITGDDRQSSYLTECENMLRPHLIMQGDEQQTVQRVRLDPETFKTGRGVRPTKVNPY